MRGFFETVFLFIVGVIDWALTVVIGTLIIGLLLLVCLPFELRAHYQELREKKDKRLSA